MSHDSILLVDMKALNEMRNEKMPNVLFIWCTGIVYNKYRYRDRDRDNSDELASGGHMKVRTCLATQWALSELLRDPPSRRSSR